MPDTVILVDPNDVPVGTAGKQEVHREPARLHRAFSIFVFNKRGELLLQRRAASKYHFAGLWTNTCCSHPAPGEDLLAGAGRRLRHEMGFTTPLRAVLRFEYKAADAKTGLTEYEMDHVLLGDYDSDPQPNPAQVDAFQWINPAALREDLHLRPGRYTPWLPIAFGRLREAGVIDTPSAG